MDGLMISDVAERTGLTASALRFYENAGIVTPARAANGYRTYTADDVDALRFVTRAKAVGLSLDEIGELLDLRDADRCAPLQDRLGELVADRLTTTRARAAELAAFAEDLEELLGQLGSHRPDGPCDESCGCLTTDATAPVTLRLGRAPAPIEAPACSLKRSELPKRLTDWARVLEGCDVARDAIGATVTIDDVGWAEIAELVDAETECCSFFTFELSIAPDGRRLRVSAPDTHQGMVDLLIGA